MDFESEPRIEPKSIVAIVVLLAMASLFVAEYQSDALARSRVLDYTLLLFAVSALIWLLDSWETWAGRWSTVIALAGLTYLGSSWLNVPEVLVLLVIPTALAVALIGFPAATMSAIGETVLLLLPRSVLAGGELHARVTAIVGIWAVFGVMYAVRRSAFQLAHWSWEYFQRARESLEEARDRQANLKQALDDLAQANLQLTRLNILAQGLRQAAEDARTAKEQFVANVSHELRTPLNMIVGFSEMIVETPETYESRIPPALLADLAVIHRNAEHLSELVDDVLDLSQIEAGQMALSKEHVRFSEIVEAAAMVVRPLFTSRGLYLETEVPEDLPYVFCDRTRIREVLLNLLSNAGRFTEQGGVRVRASREGNDLVVAVADTGTGIATEDMGKLFRPFSQVDGSIHRRHAGTGLGLSISKYFVELHGGGIWVQSEKGVGTTFFFRLPLSPPMPLEGGSLHKLIPGWEYLQRTRPSMAPEVVVRSRYVVLETGNALQRLLARYWHEVETVPVTSLDEASAELSRTPAQAVLINDLSVSKTLERLSSRERLPHDTPTIVCSIPGVHDSAGNLGASAYLVKPVSREVLLEVLGRLRLDGGTVLIVDDEPDALHLFGRMLASSGYDYRVLLARDGQEALHILQDRRPDVLLLDLVMPNMDGFRLLETMHRNPTFRDIPVVVISARDPAGQPIVSQALAVTRSTGLSVRQIMTSIEALSRALSPAARVGDPAPTGALSASPVFE